jgi:hypothetical protein
MSEHSEGYTRFIPLSPEPEFVSPEALLPLGDTNSGSRLRGVNLVYSGVTEEEGALRHILCGGPCCHCLTEILYLY